jgi:hypothetical protein
VWGCGLDASATRQVPVAVFLNTTNFRFNETRRIVYQISDCCLLKTYSVTWILTNPKPSTSPTTVLSTTVERSEKYQRRGTQNLKSSFACTVTLHYPWWVLYLHCAPPSSSSSSRQRWTICDSRHNEKCWANNTNVVRCTWGTVNWMIEWRCAVAFRVASCS